MEYRKLGDSVLHVSVVTFGVLAAGGWMKSKFNSFYFVFFLLPCIHFAQKISEPEFSHTRGFYDAPFDLALSSDTVQAVIRYTLDGSKPDHNTGELYTAPIHISSTTAVRAICDLNGIDSSDVRTHTFIFIHDVMQQDNSGVPQPQHSQDHVYWTEEFDIKDVTQTEDEIKAALKDIPTMSIVAPYGSLFGINGILRGQNLESSGSKAGDPNEAGWEEIVGCSIEMIYPENNKYSKYKNWQENSGIKIQGGGGRWNNGYYDHKQSFTLEFKKEYGAGLLKNDIFAAAPFNRSTSPGVFDKIILRAGHNKSWGADWDREHTVYTRDQFGRTLQILMSGWGSHGTFVHLYINGKYWGLYNPSERMDDNTLAIYFGGDNADYYYGKGKGGDQAGDDGRYDYLNNTSWTNKQLSELGEYLAIDEYIDLCLLYCYSNPGDGPQYYYGNSNEPAGPEYFTAWDIEDSFEGGSRRTGPPVSIETLGGGDRFYAYFKVKNNIDYKMKFADRVYKHCYNEGILTDYKAGAVWDSLCSYIENAILCEIARWGDERGELYNYQHWLGEWQNVKDDINGRAAKLIAELKNANMYPNTLPPILKYGDREITSNTLFTDSNFQLTIQSGQDGGTIYYTIDGTDPQSWDLTGNVSSHAIRLVGQNNTIAFPGIVDLKLRTKNNNEWSPLRELKIVPKNESGIAINEINYNSAHDFDTEDWVEIYNNSESSISLNNWKLTDSDSTNVFQFPDNFIIEKDKYLVVCRDTLKFKQLFPAVNNCIGNMDYKLNNDGDEVRLYNGNDIVDDVKYEHTYPWPIESIGNGATIELILPYLDNSKPENWAASQNFGTPGSINSAIISTIKEIQINKIPSEFLLSQNYPNPFNPSTRIEFSIPKETNMTLEVFDILGRKVATLIDGNKNAGSYNVEFNASHLSSGIYFYILNASGKTITKKMLLLK